MIWRLTYCNKNGAEARIDIIKGTRTPVEVVQGSGQPFTLSYKLDKNDKSGHIMTSSADIEIFETETFNIDDLKTSNETELKVEYFEDNILTWSGFILPDFFSREIGSPNIVRMTASDRLTALKGITLSDLPAKVSLRDLIELSLGQTGLTLGLTAQVQLFQGSVNILDSEILSQRLTDVRGRSVNCYDILMSIMVGTNSTIRQRAGQWQVYNKLEHESRTPTIFFDKVEKGAIRTIQPVASSVGVYQEHGGGLNYPTNYDFSDNLNGWSAINGFIASIDNRQVDVYSFSGGKYTPSYKGVGDSNYVVNKYNNLFTDASSPYLKSDIIGVIYPAEKTFNVEVEINATNAMLAATNTVVDFAIIIEGNGNTLSMDGSGLFNEVVGGKPFIHRMLFPKAMPTGGGFIHKAATASKKVQGLAISPDDNFEGYTIHIRIYGSGGSFQSLIHSVSLKFSSVNEAPKGNLYKTTQGSNFTKQHDIETTIFGDYITNGLNGYFYNYPIDDTSSLYLPSGELSSPIWKTVFDATERPLLHHISRQKSRLFSVAHDILKANINVESFDPLSVFEDCKGGKYVVVSANFDFLRSEVDVELEQIAYDNTISKRDFIYSYFGEGEDTIKSIGGIAGGGGVTGGGGGMTSEQLEMLTNLADWWRLDEENDAIYSLKSVYSLKGVSALGLGSGGGGGGGDFYRLDEWVDYNETKANWVLSALLGYDLHTRVNDLEASGGGSGNIEVATTGSGNAVTGVSLSGNTLTFAKSITFALSTHNHAIADITGLQDALDGKEPSFIKNTAFNKNFGTTTGTVAQGNDSRIINGQTAYNWGNHASAGYALNLALTAHINKVDNPHAVTKSQVGLGNVDNVKQATKSDIDIAIDGIEIGVRNLFILNQSLWERGSIASTNGSNESGNTRLRTVGFLPMESNQNYYLSIHSEHNVGIFAYDEDDNYLGFLGSSVWQTQSTILQSPTGIAKFKMIVSKKDNTNITLDELENVIVKLEKGNKATDWTPAPEDVDAAIDAIEIGGRNYILESLMATHSNFTTGFDLKGKWYQYSAGSRTVTNLDVFEAETSYILSFEFVAVDGSNATPYFRISYTDGTFSPFLENTHSPFVTNANKTVRAVATSFNTVGVIRVYNVKFEKGNKATDWTPALEDTQAKFDAKLSLTGGTLSGNLTAPTFIGALSGNASSATKLQTARTIWGQSFNGTGNVLGALTGATTGSFSASVSTPKVDFGNGFTIEPSGTELVFKYNGVIRQRMLSNGTILATGGVAALATT